MHRKTVLVTGATDGIGRQTAVELARLGAHVIVHGRNEARAQEVKQAILRDERGAEISTAVADLSSRAEVRALAADIQARFPRLDVLLNNAGVFMRQRVLTGDGIEMTFMVNHLAPMLLTHDLLPLLSKSAGARVVNVSSIAHQRAVLDWQNVEGESRFDGYGAYALSKLGNILFTQALARRVPAAQLSVFALHPGVISTKLLRAGFGMSGADLASGAKTSVFAATSSELNGLSGLYLSDSRVTASSSLSRDAEVQERFFRLSTGRLGLEWS